MMWYFLFLLVEGFVRTSSCELLLREASHTEDSAQCSMSLVPQAST